MGMWGSGSFYLAAACLTGTGLAQFFGALRPELGTLGTPGNRFCFVPLFGTFSGCE